MLRNSCILLKPRVNFRSLEHEDKTFPVQAMLPEGFPFHQFNHTTISNIDNYY